MQSANTSRLRVGFAVALGVVSAAILALTAFTHHYRYPIDEQREPWHDGLKRWDNGEYDPHSADTFDPALYENIRSVADAAAYLRPEQSAGDEEALLYAAYDLVRMRFMHFMYPHHTWRTNPILALLEFLFPQKSYNRMALADMKLRHSSGVECGGAATTFVEVYRAVGGEASFVSFVGPTASHQVAEARIGEKRYFVDADLEVIAPFSTEDFIANADLVRSHYAARSEEDIDLYLSIYSVPPILAGYDGPPTDAVFGYRVQRALEVVKFAVPIAGLALAALLMRRALRGPRS